MFDKDQYRYVIIVILKRKLQSYKLITVSLKCINISVNNLDVVAVQNTFAYL